MLAHYLQHLALFFLFFTPFLENNKNDHDSTFNLFTTLFSNKKVQIQMPTYFSKKKVHFP
jgi:hypothetical protein